MICKIIAYLSLYFTFSNCIEGDDLNSRPIIGVLAQSCNSDFEDIYPGE
jgi:hypothetical protein